MTVTVLLIGLIGVSAFMGRLLTFCAKFVAWLYGWGIFFYALAVVIALCVIIEIIIAISARKGGGRRRRRHRR